jgi:hypothetical protein
MTVKIPIIGIENPASDNRGNWLAETNLGIEATSSCGKVNKQVRLSAPSEVVFQLPDTSECDGCVVSITAREPKEGVDVQFDISTPEYRGKCPHIGTERLRY